MSLLMRPTDENRGGKLLILKGKINRPERTGNDRLKPVEPYGSVPPINPRVSWGTSLGTRSNRP